MNSTTHATDRVRERMTEAGWDIQTQDRLLWAANELAAQTHPNSEAIRLAVLPEIVGEVWGDRSNGNEVWGIYRGRYLCTIMLRRSTQPKTTESLRVSKVTIIGK